MSSATSRIQPFGWSLLANSVPGTSEGASYADVFLTAANAPSIEELKSIAIELRIRAEVVNADSEIQSPSCHSRPSGVLTTKLTRVARDQRKKLRGDTLEAFHSWIITMRIRFALTCATLLLAVSSASADKREKTHAVKPAELLAVIGQADKIVVSDSMPAAYVGSGSVPPRSLYSSASPRDISELREAIAVEPPKGWFRCACIPPIEIILFRSGKELGVISVQDDLTNVVVYFFGALKPVFEKLQTLEIDPTPEREVGIIHDVPATELTDRITRRAEQIRTQWNAPESGNGAPG